MSVFANRFIILWFQQNNTYLNESNFRNSLLYWDITNAHTYWTEWGLYFCRKKRESQHNIFFKELLEIWLFLIKILPTFFNLGLVITIKGAKDSSSHASMSAVEMLDKELLSILNETKKKWPTIKEVDCSISIDKKDSKACNDLFVFYR